MTRLATPAAAVLFSAADVGLTLLYQPPDYWSGRYDLAVEGNPLARPFLAWHPLAFVGLAVGWWLALAVGLTLAPRRWADPLGALFVFSHGFGAASWIWIGAPFGGVLGPAWLAVAVVVARWLLGGNAKTPA